jgi:D-alanyl-D-alanine dipeptidase
MTSPSRPRWLHDPEKLQLPRLDHLTRLTVPVLPPARPSLMSPTPASSGSTAWSDEPLVEVNHPRIRLFPVYWAEGWYAAQQRLLLRSSTASRLIAAASSLPAGFGLALLDAWRPLALQAALYTAAYSDPALPPGYVSPPNDDPTNPPPHLTGGAVDVTLTFDQHLLALGTQFDEFTPNAHLTAFEDMAGPVRDLRRLLTFTMVSNGFLPEASEWWHFEYGTRRHLEAMGGQVLYGPITAP